MKPTKNIYSLKRGNMKSLLPVLVLSVCNATTTVGDTPPTSEQLKEYILALF